MGKRSNGMRIGILTAGGDCPGINAAIRGVGKTAIVKYGMEVVGISDGYTGMITKEYRELSEKDLSGILTLGGTILGTSREKPFKDSGKKKNEIKSQTLLKNITTRWISTVLFASAVTGHLRRHICFPMKD
jgi:6-phosphofructokinase